MRDEGRGTVSDIDLGLVLDDPLLATDGDQVAELANSIKASNRPFADRLSVFWGSVDSFSGASSGGRFPPLDRLDLKKYGRLLTGGDVRSRLPLPTHRELAIEAIAAGVLPLCHEFLLDHEHRLREYEKPELAESFRIWRQRLET